MTSLSERLYKALLYLYPSEFRQAYGTDMLQVFRDMHHDQQAHGVSGWIRLWGCILIDLFPSVFKEHLDNSGNQLMTTMKIDQYEVKRQLASGATSSIYLVEDPTNQRDVIMKLWQPEGDFDAETLKREVDAMIALEHPNIPDVYDYVENHDQPYYIMEYIEGETLLERVQKSDSFLEESTIVQWGIQLCDILNHFHNNPSQPYLFRDVKPANVMINHDGKLYLIDFGITVVFKADHEYDLIGTEGYASPEQYNGVVDPRSDIYALGATLHHLSTRVDPRPNHNPTAQPFTFAPLRAINPKLSKAFANIISKATAYEADDRYQTVDELKVALLACQASNKSATA